MGREKKEVGIKDDSRTRSQDVRGLGALSLTCPLYTGGTLRPTTSAALQRAPIGSQARYTRSVVR